MRFLPVPDLAAAPDVFDAAGYGRASAELHALWRYSMWIERKLVQGLRGYARDHPDQQGPIAALQYYKLINDGIFFAGDSVDRVKLLYDAYQQHPKLTAGAAREL